MLGNRRGFNIIEIYIAFFIVLGLAAYLGFSIWRYSPTAFTIYLGVLFALVFGIVVINKIGNYRRDKQERVRDMTRKRLLDFLRKGGDPTKLLSTPQMKLSEMDSEVMECWPKEREPRDAFLRVVMRHCDLSYMCAVLFLRHMPEDPELAEELLEWYRVRARAPEIFVPVIRRFLEDDSTVKPAVVVKILMRNVPGKPGPRWQEVLKEFRELLEEHRESLGASAREILDRVREAEGQS